MELRHLRYFIRVAEERHFGRAAERLGISQPPLSQQIRALEDELGVQLLERDSRNVSLTTAGAVFLEHAKATLAEAEIAKRAAKRAANGDLGHLTIGFNPSVPFVPVVAAALKAFRRQHPDVTLQYVESAGAEQVELVDRGSLDVSLLRRGQRPTLPSGVTAELIFTEPLAIVVDRSHRLASAATVTWSDIEGEPLILYGLDRTDGFSSELLSLIARAGVSAQISNSVNELTTLFALVSLGAGIAILPDSLRFFEMPALLFVPLDEATATVSLWRVRKAGEVQGPLARFLDALQTSACRGIIDSRGRPFG